MFFPRKSKIFNKLAKLSSIVKHAGDVLHNLTHDWKQLKNAASELRDLERQADELVKSITNEIETVFILPLDKEDIGDLTECLDDVVDNVEEAVNRLHIYKISESNETLRAFAQLIRESAGEIHKGILMIKEQKIASEDFALCGSGLRDLESQGDKVHRNALEKMMDKDSSFLNGNDYLSILKWKEIFETLENTLDKCDNIAKLFSRLRIKYI